MWETCRGEFENGVAFDCPSFQSTMFEIMTLKQYKASSLWAQ